MSMPEGKHFKSLDVGPLENLRERASLGARGKFLLGEDLCLTGSEVSLSLDAKEQLDREGVRDGAPAEVESPRG